MTTTNFSNQAAFYFQRFGGKSLSYNNINLHPSCSLILVIPAYGEEPEYLLTSLEQCEVANPNSVCIIWVINQALNDEQIDFHRAQGKSLRERTLSNGIDLQVIEALDLNPKQAGVGLARKIGMDVALKAFADIGQDGLMVCLDGDCKVSRNYIDSLLIWEQEKINGASLYFEHPLQDLDSEEKSRLIDYEIWLRFYSLALAWAKFPWHYLTVGSSMVVRASAYAKIGGMNKRKAGEDFYFLHKLMPQGNFHNIPNLCVFPQARISTRVPFGTGRAMLEMQEGTKSFSKLYNPIIFNYLKGINESAARGEDPWSNSPNSLAFLDAHPKIKLSFEALKQRAKGKVFATQFKLWWDGFKVLKWVHFQQQFWPDIPADEALSKLLMIEGNSLEQLLALRALDKQR